MSRSSVPTLFALVFAAVAPACSMYSDQLKRAEDHYAAAHYEAAEVNLADLELHMGSLSNAERVRYDFVRGMTALRLDHRQTARHWLAIAREDTRVEPTDLTDTQRATIERLLVELDPLNPHPNLSVSSAPTNGESGSPAPGASTSGAPSSSGSAAP